MITLKTLPQATAQQVFDQVAAHLLKQRTRSANDKVCLYIDKERGLKCAAGCLIADEEYNENFEGETWEKLLQFEWVPHEHSELIQGLQGIHDITSPKLWATNLREFANIHGLSFNEGQNDNT